MVMTISPRPIARLALLGTALLPGAMARAQQSDGLGIVTGNSDNGRPGNVLVVRAGPAADPPGRAASDSTPKPTTTTEGERLEEYYIRLFGSRNQCAQCHAADTTKRVFAAIEDAPLGRLLVDFGGTPDSQGLGATLEQADGAVRAQLGLSDDRGLIVTGIDWADAQALRTGLLMSDILLTLDGKPLGRPEDLTARLREAADKAVPLALIRAGKPMTIQVKPVYRLSFTAIQPEKTEYSIGVTVKPIDLTLRTHLPKLSDRPGLVVEQVNHDSPAAKAGLKPSDILLAVDTAPVADIESLAARIQATGGKPVQCQILRAGKGMTIMVTPSPKGPSSVKEVVLNEVIVCPGLKAQEEWSKALADSKNPRMWLNWNFPHLPRDTQGAFDTWSKSFAPSNQPHPGSTADSDRVEKRLDALGRELKQLQESIEALRKSLKPDDKPVGRGK